MNKQQVNCTDETESLGKQVWVVALTRSVFLHKPEVIHSCRAVYSHSTQRCKHPSPAVAGHEARLDRMRKAPANAHRGLWLRTGGTQRLRIDEPCPDLEKPLTSLDRLQQDHMAKDL